MVRFVIIGVVLAVAFTLYALIDAAMTDASRARGVSKPVWIVLIVLLPVIGGALWFMLGKGSGAPPAPTRAPDDDPRFTGTRMSGEDLDAHMRDLEERLRELDDEVYPGEQQESRATDGTDDGGSDGAEGDAPAGDPSTEQPEQKDHRRDDPNSTQR
ncbi:MAG: PLD nuclease N-terminal domain-containing protein [Leucobacter sp.]